MSKITVTCGACRATVNLSHDGERCVGSYDCPTCGSWHSVVIEADGVVSTNRCDYNAPAERRAAQGGPR